MSLQGILANKCSFKIYLLLGKPHLDLQGFWHLWWWWAGESKLNLDTIIDEPLQSSEGTNHDDSGTKTSPQSSKSKSLNSITNTGSLSLVEIRHKSVSGVGDNSAEDTSNVTSCKGDNQLFTFGAFSSWFWNYIGINSLNGSLKAGKLHHCVRNLSAPQRNNRFVKATRSLFLENSWEGSSQSCWEGSHWGGLNSDLAGLHW